MATMRAMVVKQPGGDFVLEERAVPEPGFDHAVVRVHACGVCHSDVLAKEGGSPGVSHPLVPGHEIAGEIAALGDGVKGWRVGQRVGVGWFGGNCGYCEWCRRGDLMNCENMEIPGITIDGGYADYLLVKPSAMASVPDDLASEDAAPLLCAGITPITRCATAGREPETAPRSSASAAWLSPSFAPRDHSQRTSGRGRIIEHYPKPAPRHQPNLQPRGFP